MTPVALLPTVVSERLRHAVVGWPCALRVSSLYPGHTCSSDETTVFCHLPGLGKSMAAKTSDLSGAAGCFNCHAIVDGPDRHRREFILSKYPAAFAERLRLGNLETMSRLYEAGIISVKGAKR